MNSKEIIEADNAAKDERIKELEAEIAGHEWISVEDGMPMKRKRYPEYFSVEVLVFDGEAASVGSYNYEDRIWRSCRKLRPENITQWKYFCNPITLPAEGIAKEDK